MKRLTPERRVAWNRLSKKRHCKILQRSPRRRAGRPVSAIQYPRYPRSKDEPVLLRAPEVFDLFEESNRRRLLRLLADLRRVVGVERRDARILFAQTKQMKSGGTLLFTAELRRLTASCQGVNKISCTYPQNNKVEQVLQQIGVLDLLKKPKRATPTAEDVVHWRFIDGTQAEGEKAGRMLEAFEKLPSSLRKGLYVGVVEAMTNCVHHAYSEPRGDELDRASDSGWWMFAQEREGKLTVVVCDLGIGIPRSLPKTQDPSRLTQVLSDFARSVGVRGYRDADLIEAALRLGKSRTGEAHRGLGLAQFRDVVESVTDGGLRIFSNRGCYTFAVQQGQTWERRMEYKGSIRGTLIQWTVPLGVS